ncbi:MAG: hypothetical protein M5R36_12990 [Deltaproteobacteria bacterium]|nr:hypothetical protein [Deltaproteobacteria bacterium]
MVTREHFEPRILAGIAIQEDVGLIILWTIAGQAKAVAALRDTLAAQGADDIPLVAAGPDLSADEDALENAGVRLVVGPSTVETELREFLRTLRA